MSNPEIKIALAERVARAAKSIRDVYADPIQTAIVLGTGLSGLDLPGYEPVATIPYHQIDALPRSTAPSHDSELRLVSNENQTIALCAGRHHLYEGYTAQEVCLLTYTLRALGCETLIITNASGGLNPAFTPGEIMLLNDHINLTGHNPLIGQDERLGIRFPDMSEPYDKSLIDKTLSIAGELKLRVHQGVYAGVCGPSLETSAERRMLRVLGADAVGMSTVLEVIAANHCGLRVLTMAAITNMATGDENQQPDTLEDVLANATLAAQGMREILSRLV
ncbi:purine nucleoside phosphorylase [Arenicella chitinivorans]|uniref:Purine nucleoside phosphorylase n=1 Tax=Arenicella chitinivorans TaxID=1329800 RepID=A0A918S0A7_9GAMM|nr:purine-nucleoside phosphorylase [Arenicella chitinivorans]GHA19199.1 purine nucleoside phosphorylase [Arenicella chitinivorans]